MYDRLILPMLFQQKNADKKNRRKFTDRVFFG